VKNIGFKAQFDTDSKYIEKVSKNFVMIEKTLYNLLLS